MHVLMKPLREAVHKEMHKKYMKDMFKSVHQMRKVASMTPEQQRQAFLGIGVGVSMAAKRMNEKKVVISNRVKILLAIVVVPVFLPLIVVFGLPLLLLGLPLIAFVTTLLTLNAKANAVLNMNKREKTLQRNQSRFANMYKSFYGTNNNPALDDGEEKKQSPSRSFSFRRSKKSSSTNSSVDTNEDNRSSEKTAVHIKHARFQPAPVRRSRTFTFGSHNRGGGIAGIFQ